MTERPSSNATTTPLQAAILARTGLRHGFFNASCAVTKGEAPQADAASRSAIANALGLSAPDRLVFLDQIHSARAIEVSAPPASSLGDADGAATAAPGLGLAIMTADCAPVLLADLEARVIGAAHAGWRGALAGVVEATVTEMVALGAAPRRIRAAIGPCIHVSSYEVGEDFADAFATSDPLSSRFFLTDETGRLRFDLPGYVAHRLAQAGVLAPETVGPCVYQTAPNWLSYRRAQHQGEAAHGRNVSAIALESDEI